MMSLEDFIVKQEDTKSSRRLYRMTCISCGVDRGYQRKSRVGSGRCKKCASSFAHKGKMTSEETAAKMRASSWLKKGGRHPLLGKQHSAETKAKLSVKAATQNKAYKGNFLYSGPKGALPMKSSWEVKYALYLDSKGLQWTYEPCFKLSNGYVYLPDFQLSTGDIIEIKGYMREDANIKWNMFCEEYPELKKSLITKVEMKQLGLIK